MPAARSAPPRGASALHLRRALCPRLPPRRRSIPRALALSAGVEDDAPSGVASSAAEANAAIGGTDPGEAGEAGVPAAAAG